MGCLLGHSAFITAVNFPDLAAAFAASVAPACLEECENQAVISIIGEPGVGKSYVARKLSEGVLGEAMVTEVQAVSRDAVPDLILWASHENDKNQIIQYDEASLRFVDEEYRDLVMSERGKAPIPAQHLSGLKFVEHPDVETEEQSDVVIHLSFSKAQKKAMDGMHATVTSIGGDLQAHKDALSDVAAQGCLLEMDFSGDFVDKKPLIEFFDAQPDVCRRSSGYANDGMADDYDWNDDVGSSLSCE